jgi:hypothetical protein
MINSSNLKFQHKIILLITTILFSILSFFPIAEFGVLGIFNQALQNSATIQIFIDLVISLLLFSLWLKQDAKANNRNFIFWFIFTFALGSFGPLFYLLTAKTKK